MEITSKTKGSFNFHHLPPPALFFAAIFLGHLADRSTRSGKSENRLLKYLGFLLFDAGIAFGIWALVWMLKQGQNPNPAAEKTKLITDGPFKLSRNPIYLASALAALGRSVQGASPTSALLTFALLLHVDRHVVPAEEEYLSEKFGATYDEYRSSVPRWIPGIPL